MSAAETSSGPDLTQGIALDEITDDGVVGGHVGEDTVVLARVGGELVAISGACSHYGGPLKDGLRVGAAVRCPLHHACFDLRTGAALAAPALAPLDRWKVEERGGKAFVTEKLAPVDAPERDTSGDPKAIVVVGGGAAGFAAAQRLRDLGYDGKLTVLSADDTAPYDRPNLSKDYLAGEADPAWMPLKDAAFYAENRIELRLSTLVTKFDPDARQVSLADGSSLDYDALLLATGAEPNRPTTPGFDRANVFVLRSQHDSDAIIAALDRAKTAAVIGASFIGLEAAAALRTRGLAVHVVAPEALPLERVMGPQIGRFIQDLHEARGVQFHLQHTASGFDGKTLTLDDGETLAVDLVVLGVGVRPRLELAEVAGLKLDKGVVVDACFRTSAQGVFAAGDIARYADPVGDAPIRVEHWVAAERQGQIAAANMLGLETRIDEPAFFWSAHYDVSIRYVGHAEHWDRIAVEGDLAAQDATVRYFSGDKLLAAATVGRDLEALRIGQSLSRGPGQID
ncbi:MAG TPA: FAD-dependent oxidoreductase [Caulobacteraceae bacterium]|jgi:NADPH-dependent 2,4-dienoyl-CoA reductase/sulfur reductase-like enzyme/nitrite reductase/ring-hydroxylating ferredoxin subunit|nr:FAD-dependent oxidoreductase [Caulobacteraceae bacterium]